VIAPKRLEDPPDLVIEVFSLSTKAQDKESKFKLYERHGVREYWMLDPDERLIEVWGLSGVIFHRSAFSLPIRSSSPLSSMDNPLVFY
jgi:Uma2 family endonuclease